MEKGISLYELGEAYKNLPYVLDSQDPDELKVYLNSIEVQIREKSSNIVMYAQNLNLTAEGIDNEIERLKELRDSYKKKAQRLKDYISWVLQENDIKLVESELFRLSFRKSESVEVYDITQLPESFLKVKIEKNPDKDMIKKAIKSGVEVPGATVVTKQNLQIK